MVSLHTEGSNCIFRLIPHRVREPGQRPVLHSGEPQIRGVAWCGPNGQEPWRFTLAAGPEAVCGGQVDWAALMPGDELTGWLIPDHGTKTRGTRAA
jgi:hypothetical protein